MAISWANKKTIQTRITDICGSSDLGYLFVCANPAYGQMDYSADKAQTWALRNPASFPYDGQVKTRCSSTGAVVYTAVYGSGKDIFKSTDYGASWTDLTNSATSNLNGLACSSDGTKLLAAPNYGYIKTSADSGASWTDRTGAGQRYWKDVAMSDDGTKMYALSNSDGVYVSTDSGANWTQKTQSSTTLTGVCCSGDGSIVYVGNVGSAKIAKSTNSGANWSDINCPSSYGVPYACSNDGSVVIIKVFDAFSRAVTYLSTDSGANWAEQSAVGYGIKSGVIADDGNSFAILVSDSVWYGSNPVGPANVKSYNTNLKANIKTINTNPIGNVKSLNTNT